MRKLLQVSLPSPTLPHVRDRAEFCAKGYFTTGHRMTEEVCFLFFLTFWLVHARNAEAELMTALGTGGCQGTKLGGH